MKSHHLIIVLVAFFIGIVAAMKYEDHQKNQAKNELQNKRFIEKVIYTPRYDLRGTQVI